MVNVAGRSKACHTCRERRVACTQEKPECSQCLRLGYSCAGYSAERTFINVNNDFKIGVRKGRAEVDLKSQRKTSYPVIYVSGKRHSFLFDRMISSGSAYRQQLFQNFLSFYLPKEEYASGSITSWYTLYAGLIYPTAALDIAMMALCTLSLSQGSDDEYLLMISLRYYMYGLHALRRALCDAKLMYCEETVGATMALAMYEVTACPGNTRFGYVSHVRGMAKLIMARGPHAYTSPLGHGIFRMFRFVDVLHALEYQKCTFLASEYWMELPWSVSSKSLIDQVMDVIIMVSKLLRDADDIWKLPPALHANPAYNLILDYSNLDARLLIVEQSLKRSFEGRPLYQHVFSTMEQPGEDFVHGKVFPVAYWFDDFPTAHVVLLLWTALSMTRSALEGLSKYLWRKRSDLSEEQVIELSTRIPFWSAHNFEETWIYYARNACQCVEYFLHDSTPGAARLSPSLPLHIIAGYLEADGQYTRELEWARGTLASMGSKNMRLLLYW